MNKEYESFVSFYTKAKSNKKVQLERMKAEKPTSRNKYEIERTSAFIDWCEFILEKLKETDKEEFSATAWREVYGVFEYPPYPGDES